MVESEPALLQVITAAEAAAGAGRGLPPVHLWHPERCGEIDIRIRRDGSWWHEERPITRAALVRLFSTVLRRDPDGYYLVTPVEMLKITVEDAPFVAVAMSRCGEDLVFTTNVGDEVAAGAETPIRIAVDLQSGEPAPYVEVRRGLEARLARPVFYELVEMAEQRGDALGVSSGGAWFGLGPALP